MFGAGIQNIQGVFGAPIISGTNPFPKPLNMICITMEKL